MAAVGLVGIGDLGFAIARNLMGRGHDVVGYRRRPMDAFVAAGGKPATSPRDVAERSEVVLTCLPTAESLTDVVSGVNGLAAAGGKSGLTIFELSTLPVSAKARSAQMLENAGAKMLDCAVSGNPNFVVARTAIIFASGDRAAFDAHRGVLDDITDNVRYVGEFGAGTALKLIVAVLVPIHTLAAAEAMGLATRAGLDRKLVFDAVKGTPASSGMFETRGAMMVERNYAPSGGIAGYMKNVEMAIELAGQNGGTYPLLTAMRECYAAAIAGGLGHVDQAGIFEHLMRADE
jgi:3-hydroxyisobutyrate dehydrogenase